MVYMCAYIMCLCLVREPEYPQLLSIPEFSALGEKLRSVFPEELTDDESEYQVSVIKHIYPQHVLLQFQILNQMKENLLVDVNIEVESENDWEIEVCTKYMLYVFYYVICTGICCISVFFDFPAKT